MRSPTTTAGTFVFARGMTGMIEQSATKALSRPWIRPRASVTASGSSSAPHRAGADRVVVVLDGAVDPALQRRVILRSPAPGQLRAEQIAQRRLRRQLPRDADPVPQHRAIVSFRVGDVAVIDARFTPADRASAA